MAIGLPGAGVAWVWRAFGVLSVVAACTFVPTLAHAQGSEALAQRLFDDALELMENGRFAEACPKLAESHRIDPGGGTLLNLAACLEQDGKLASAYARYSDALSTAVRDGRGDRELVAREHLAAIRPRVSTLSVRVPSEPGLDVRLDGTPLGAEALRSPLPIDPGAHVLLATAPGKKTFEKRFEVLRDASLTEVVVPPFESLPQSALPLLPPSGAPLLPTKVDPEGPRAPWVLAGTGLGLLTVGAVTGALAFSSKGSSDAGCPTSTTCTDDGAAAMKRARAFAWTSTVTVGLGLVALGVGTVWLFAAPTAEARAEGARKLAWLAPDGSVRW